MTNEQPGGCPVCGRTMDVNVWSVPDDKWKSAATCVQTYHAIEFGWFISRTEAEARRKAIRASQRKRRER